MTNALDYIINLGNKNIRNISAYLITGASVMYVFGLLQRFVPAGLNNPTWFNISGLQWMLGIGLILVTIWINRNTL